MCYRRFLRIWLCCVLIAGCAAVAPAVEWQSHSVRKLNGAAPETLIPAKLQIATNQWNTAPFNGIAACPSMVYMPEKDRLLMSGFFDYPLRNMIASSDDRGTTWTEPVSLSGRVLTYLGNGELIASTSDTNWLSGDYGQTWTSMPSPPASNGRPWIQWDPMLVDKNPTTGQVERIMSYCTDNLQPDGHFQGYVRFSTDKGATWHNEIKVPQMYRVNEVAFARAVNGDIIAACRTDNPDEYENENDHYGGLAVSVSEDNGSTWSDLNVLYEYGRHHPSMVLMSDGKVVMTYVVRKGYDDTPEGYPRFGIEAVISNDNGQTWDLDHRYILDEWAGNSVGAWWQSSQSTASVLLPDGSILTAYGTGYRATEPYLTTYRPRDIGLVNWRLESIPEPSSLVILGTGFLMVVCYFKRKRWLNRSW